MKSDPITLKRLEKFLVDHRQKTAQLATLKDIQAAGFSRELVDEAKKNRKIKELYVTLTNGSIVKGYKV